MALVHGLEVAASKNANEEQGDGDDCQCHQRQIPTPVEHDAEKHEELRNVPERTSDSDLKRVLKDMEVIGEPRDQITCFGASKEREGEAEKVVKQPLSQLGNEALNEPSEAVDMAEEEETLEDKDNDKGESDEEVLLELRDISVSDCVHNVFCIKRWGGGENIEPHHADETRGNPTLVGQNEQQQSLQGGGPPLQFSTHTLTSHVVPSRESLRVIPAFWS